VFRAIEPDALGAERAGTASILSLTFAVAVMLAASGQWNRLAGR